MLFRAADLHLQTLVGNVKWSGCTQESLSMTFPAAILYSGEMFPFNSHHIAPKHLSWPGSPGLSASL